MSISVSSFGQTADGRAASLYTMTNRCGASVSLCDWGARIVGIHVPDKMGKLANVSLCFDDVSGYATPDSSYIGATIGRVGNRIGGASFMLNGQEYKISANEGPNTLHGGIYGFDRHWWTAQCGESDDGDLVTMTYVSADGEEGFPGELSVSVTFGWSDKNELSIKYTAQSDRDTLCNLTNHAYFNLGDTNDILDHTLQINAGHITPTDDALIPIGTDIPVDGLPVDLRTPLKIRDGLSRSAEYPMMVKKNGYDFNFAISGEGMRCLSVLRDEKSGRCMQVFSTEPCIQLYTGQGFNVQGADGRHYGPYAGLALETQHHPDAIHQPAFPSVILRKGETYETQTIYRFSTEA